VGIHTSGVEKNHPKEPSRVRGTRLEGVQLGALEGEHEALSTPRLLVLVDDQGDAVAHLKVFDRHYFRNNLKKRVRCVRGRGAGGMKVTWERGVKSKIGGRIVKPLLVRFHFIPPLSLRSSHRKSAFREGRNLTQKAATSLI